MGVKLAAWALLAVACSGNKSRPVEDAKHPAPTPAGGDDAAARADAASTTPPTPVATTGDVSVRVEWEGVPSAVRASPGTTACGTPRRPQVSPSTTWGIGDVVVIVDGAPGSIGEAHVRLEDCGLSPRIAIGSSLMIDSAADRPAKLVIAERRRAAALDAKLEESTSRRPVLLPITGHAVAVALDPGAVYEVVTEGKDPETAWIVAANAAVTDPGGAVLVKDVPSGVHAVRAWLPPRAGQPARHAAGQVTVAAGDLAELTLQLVP